MRGQSKAVLVKGPVRKTIVSLALPTIGGLVGISVVNIVDAYFLGQVSVEALAAVGYGFPIIMAFSSISGGVSGGAGTLMSFFIGKDKHKKAAKYGGDSLVLMFLFSVGLLPFVLHFVPDFLNLAGATGEVFSISIDFVKISLLGQIFLGLIFIGNACLRSRGDTLTPGIALTFAAIANGIADYFLVLGNWGAPALGVNGAAISSIIGWLIGGGIAFSKVLQMKAITLSRVSIKRISKILSYGIPETVRRLTLPVSSAIVITLVGQYGISATAAYTTASRAESLLMLSGIGIAISLNVFISQNRGANNYSRISTALHFSLWFSIVLGIVSWSILALLSESIGDFFMSDPRATEFLMLCFVIIPIGIAGRIYLVCASSSVSALGFPVDGSLMPVVYSFFIMIPVLMIGSSFFHFTGLLCAMALAGMIAIPYGYLWLSYRFNS